MGATYLVIYDANAKSRKIRAVIAGLAKFFPNPPKIIFTIIMAKAEPITGTNKGNTGGRFKARSSPVTTADQSSMVWGIFANLQ